MKHILYFFSKVGQTDVQKIPRFLKDVFMNIFIHTHKHWPRIHQFKIQPDFYFLYFD